MIAAAAAWCLAGCEAPQAVRIGFVGGLSGAVADLGVGGRNGAQLAVDALNAKGDLRYELIVEDDQQSAERARNAMLSLSKHRAGFVVGPMTSAMAIVAVPEANRLQLVLISPTATTHELSRKNDYFFRVAPDAPAGARQLAHLLFQRGARSLALLMDSGNHSYSASFGQAAAQRFRELGGKVSAEISYETAAKADFAALARQLVEPKPDAVLLVTGPGDAALLAQHLRRLDTTIRLAVSPWAANVQFLQFGGRAVEGTVALQAVNLDSRGPAMLDFRQRYRARFGDEPTTPAVQTYEAVMVGAEALRRRGADKPLREVLAASGQPWPGLEGDIVFDAYGDTDKTPHMTQVRNGRFEAVAP